MSNISFKTQGRVTPLSNIFIDNYMVSAHSPQYVLVYIYALRCATYEQSLDFKTIADKLNILESDVMQAFEYWDKVGVVSYDRNRGIITMLELSGNGSKAEEVKPKREIKADKPPGGAPQPVKPSYLPTEIAKLKSDDERLGEIFSIAEHTLGKTLTSTDIEVLTSFHDHLNLSPEMVAVLLSHTSSKSKKMRYAEVIANDWFDKGITTVEAAAAYIEAISSGSEVLRFFGIANREPSKKERDYILKWTTKLRFSKELIREACERTLNSAGKASFPYADSILESWHSKGLTTLEQVKEENRLFNEQKAIKPKPVVKTEYKPVKPNYNNKFNDFAQRTYTEEEFREIIKKKGGI